jgi:hypothetical protein
VWHRGDPASRRLALKPSAWRCFALLARIRLGSFVHFGLRYLDDPARQVGHPLQWRQFLLRGFLPRLIIGAERSSCRSSVERASEALVGKTAAEGRTRDREETRAVGELAQVVAQHLLVQIAEQVERLDRDVRALQAALEQAPEVLQAVRVDLAVNILLGVVDNAVDERVRQVGVGVERVRVDVRALLHVGVDQRAQGAALHVLHDGRTDARGAVAVAFQQAEDGDLAGPTRVRADAGALARVHVASLATDVGLVNLNVAAELAEALGLHGEADAVEHEPRRLLSDAERAVDLVGGNAVLAVHDHPEAREPLVETDGRAFEDGPDLDGELLAARLRHALPNSACLEERHGLSRAVRARHAVRPPKAREEGQRHIGVREVADRAEERFGAGFGLHAPEDTSGIVVCQVYYVPITISDMAETLCLPRARLWRMVAAIRSPLSSRSALMIASGKYP